MSRKTSFLISMLAFLVLNIGVASAAVINVPADQPTIQAGIDAALPGDVVLLSIHASYDGPGNTNIDFRGKAITVKGARDPRGLVIPVIFCAGTAQGFIFQSEEGRGSILENVKILQGNGGALGGGGIFINGASPTIRKVTILNSSSGVAATSGGAIRILNGSPLIRNCRLQNNTAAKDGGGISAVGGSPVIHQCLIAKNTAAESAGGVELDTGIAFIINCTIAQNRATLKGGGGLGIKAGKATITNSIVYFNTIGEIRTELAPKVALTYSCVRAGVIPGGNPTNLNLNPQFQSSIDWHLQPTSPVINAGTNTLRPPAVLLTTDLDGKPRVMGTSVDMGAYEFQ